MYSFAPEENYHLHALLVAKQMGFSPCAIVRDDKSKMEADPHFDKDIEVIDYKNVFQFFYHVLRLSFKGTLFYVNSYEWQSFIVPFIARKTVFMAHTQPKRKTNLKQVIQDFVYRFFTKVRLNNEEEKQYLLAQGISEKKLMVVPLVVSQEVFRSTNQTGERKDILYFGNVTAKKNLPTMIKAFEIAKKTLPDLKFNIVGKIRDESVLKIINESHHKDDFILHGFLPNDVLVEELNKSLIYLNSSTDEGQCVAVYDATLCGCVLCLPNIMSFSGVFKDCALFHDVFDSETLARNIIRYVNEPDLIFRFRKIAINLVKSGYSKEIIETKMIELFGSVN